MGLSPYFYTFRRIFILIRWPSRNIHLRACACNHLSFWSFRAGQKMQRNHWVIREDRPISANP